MDQGANNEELEAEVRTNGWDLGEGDNSIEQRTSIVSRGAGGGRVRHNESQHDVH